MICLSHNFDGKKFMWLYAKYANGCNPQHHCTNAIRGKYSRRFLRLNKDFMPGQTIVLDEFPTNQWDAIYICGVSRSGYAKHENYPHNVHVAILPREGGSDHWEFENWKMDVRGGVFERVPSEDEIPEVFVRQLPEKFWTCRMWRWAISHYSEVGAKYESEVWQEELALGMQQGFYQ
jgi:hypothetical protein